MKAVAPVDRVSVRYGRLSSSKRVEVARKRFKQTPLAIRAPSQLPSSRQLQLSTKQLQPRGAVLQESVILEESSAQDQKETQRPALVLSPGGFLVSYYLGVLECLTDLDLQDESTPISGTSAGALAAAFSLSGLSHEDSLNVTLDTQRRLSESGYDRKVVAILQQTLQEILPEDIHLRATNHVGIGLSVYTPKLRRSGKVLMQFSSRDEFINAVAASCYIPFFLGPELGIEWSDGCIYSDGMPTNFFPQFPSESPHATKDALTVDTLSVEAALKVECRFLHCRTPIGVSSMIAPSTLALIDAPGGKSLVSGRPSGMVYSHSKLKMSRFTEIRDMLIHCYGLSNVLYRMCFLKAVARLD